jgi:hypothetical protein
MADFEIGKLSVQTGDGWQEIGEVQNVEMTCGVDKAGGDDCSVLSIYSRREDEAWKPANIARMMSLKIPIAQVAAEQLREATEAAQRIAEAVKPVVAQLINAFLELSRQPSWTWDGDPEVLKRIIKKSRNRERYYRRYARRGERMKKHG